MRQPWTILYLSREKSNRVQEPFSYSELQITDLLSLLGQNIVYSIDTYSQVCYNQPNSTSVTTYANGPVGTTGTG